MEKQNLLNKSLLAFLASFLSLVLFLFLLNIFIRQYSDKSLWDISLAVFALLGVLLTAGAAFATVAAVISFFSVNQKLKNAEIDLKNLSNRLKESEKNLQQSQDNLKKSDNNLTKLNRNLKESEETLSRFKTLDDERNELEGANKKLKEYKAAVQGLENKNVTDNSDLQKHIELILKSPNALFQHRIIANAIQSDIEADKKIESNEYQQAIELSEYSKECWKVLFLYNSEQNVANYTKSMFNLAYCYGELDTKNYAYIYQLYQEIITLSDKYTLHNMLIENTYNNWGFALADEANAMQSTDLVTARALWQKAGEKYAKAVAIKEDMYEAYNNWGSTLLDEANAISDIEPQEALQLRKKVKTLLTDFVTKYPDFSGEIAYNLGCIFAYEGNVQEIIKQFEMAREESALPPKEHIEKDGDLDGVRDTPEFQSWFNKTFK